jgi:hypothetical protein
MQTRQELLFQLWIAPVVTGLFLFVNSGCFAQNPIPEPTPSPAPGPPQTPAHVCIGDGCNKGKYENLQILGCEFAYAHPSDTDEEAARYVCQFIQNVQNYENSDYQRIGSEGGGKCGAIYLVVKCH